MVGPWQIIILLILLGIVLTGVFILGYSIGKKAGYIKRVKEIESQMAK